MAFVLEGYIDVAERIREFKKAFPNGSLQPANPSEPFKIVEIGGKVFIAYAAAAYRTPDDPRPGIGVAYEPFPGKTNYTRDSELMNAETSAWGRAIVAALAAGTQKIASLEEVRNRQAAEREDAPSEHPAQRSREEMIAAADARGKAIKAEHEAKAAVGSKAVSPRSDNITPITDAITPNQVTLLSKLMKEKNVGLSSIAESIGLEVADVKALSKRDASKAIKALMEKN